MYKQTAGSIEKVSPVQCNRERILIPIAGRLAGKFFRKKRGMFIQKHYNDMFLVISLIENKTKKKK